MITHRTINGKEIEIKVKFGQFNTVDWEASHDGKQFTSGVIFDVFNDVREAIPEIVDMVEISLDFDGMDVCPVCGRSNPENTDCPNCLKMEFDVADFVAAEEAWVTDVLKGA